MDGKIWVPCAQLNGYGYDMIGYNMIWLNMWCNTKLAWVTHVTRLINCLMWYNIYCTPVEYWYDMIWYDHLICDAISIAPQLPLVTRVTRHHFPFLFPLLPGLSITRSHLLSDNCQCHITQFSYIHNNNNNSNNNNNCNNSHCSSALILQ